MSDDKAESKDKAAKNKKPSKDNSTPAKEYEDRIKAVNAIAHPLASKKTTKKLYKLVKKAASAKHVRRGVKEVVKGLRKGEKGLAVMAGDIYPMDTISHLPLLLEENDVPYIFVPSKHDLGASASTKRPTSCVLVRTPNKNFEAQDIYDALLEEAKEYDPQAVIVKVRAQVKS
jgi:H/ACA ribonucleoprotein complex subunit 2